MCGCAAVTAREIVAFLDAVLRCFLSWFRSSPAAAHRDPLVHRGPFRALRFGGSRGSHEHHEHGRDNEDELRQEADYHKLCGAISQTPAELQKSSEINLERTNEVGNVSRMEGTSVSRINSSECFKCQEDHALMTENEVTRVESVPLEKSPFWNIKNRFSDCSGSSFPTPLVLTDDMQTPGTIYTSHEESSLSRKSVRTCQQFVYPVLRPAKIKTQKKEETEDSPPMLPPNTPKQISLGADYIKKLQKTPTSSVAKVGFLKSAPICFANENAPYQEKETLSVEELKCQTSRQKSNSDEKHAALSTTHWLKPSLPDGDNQGAVSSSATNKLHDEKTLPTETPVFTSASELEEDVENLTPTLPKAWDGNGIPNTVTKYKEDQKVRWHATPFEERLSRALSGEANHPRKLNSGNPFNVEDDNGIPNTTAKYKEDQKVGWHVTPFEGSLSRVLPFEFNTPSRNSFCVEDHNGIPNTVSKYKEDQEVSWHGTPSEERLLRVLSDGPNPTRGASIPNTATKYNEDHKVNMHTTPFEERLLRCLSDEREPPKETYQRKLVPCRGNLLEEEAEYKWQGSKSTC